MVVSCDFFVLSGRGLCDRAILRPGESYCVSVLVCLCVFLSVIRCSITLYTYNDKVEEFRLRKQARRNCIVMS